MSAVAMVSNNNNSNVATLSVHDPEFKNLITVPVTSVHHLPPAQYDISRLVLCRKYDPRNPEDSCPMGDRCKFVHIDLLSIPRPALGVQSIHVNYAYRTMDEVIYNTLPAGDFVTVSAPNNRGPAQDVPSELVLATAGALNRHSIRAPLSHCAHFYYNRTCNRGDNCTFIHTVCIDPTAKPHQRAPPRAGAGYQVGAKPQSKRTFQPVAQTEPSRYNNNAHHTPSYNHYEQPSPIQSQPSSQTKRLRQMTPVPKSSAGSDVADHDHASNHSSCDLSESNHSAHGMTQHASSSSSAMFHHQHSNGSYHSHSHNGAYYQNSPYGGSAIPQSYSQQYSAPHQQQQQHYENNYPQYQQQDASCPQPAMHVQPHPALRN